MIGQHKILDYIEKNISHFPSFTILVAPHGCGKRTIAKYIAEKLGAGYAPCGVKVEEVREIINVANKVSERMLYCFEDADTMRSEAKNAMLKITEEPPRNAYFVMTVESDSSLLDTIKSRAVVLHLEPYTGKELAEYFDSIEGKSDCDKGLTIDIANTPYEVKLLFEYGADFIDYVNLVVDNIAEVEPANAFKSSKALSFKREDEDNYNLLLFWETFNRICIEKILDDPLHYAQGINVTAPFITKAMKPGVNLSQLYDNWVFKIREVWI